MKTNSSPVLLGVGILLSLTQIHSAHAGTPAETSKKKSQGQSVYQSPEESLSVHVLELLQKGKMSADTKAAYLQASAIFYSIFPMIEQALSGEVSEASLVTNDLGKEWFDGESSESRNKIQLSLRESEGTLHATLSMPEEDFESSFELVGESKNSLDTAFIKRNANELEKIYRTVFAFIRNTNSQEQAQSISLKNLKKQLQNQILQSQQEKIPMHLISMEKILQRNF